MAKNDAKVRSLEKNMTRMIAGYQLAVGASVVVWWAVMLIIGEVPEVQAGNRDIWFHVGAEAAMAALLIFGGWLLFRNAGRLARGISAMALGTLLYSVINGAGYFAERGEWPMVGLFAGLTLLTGVAAFRLLVPGADAYGATPQGPARRHRVLEPTGRSPQ